MAPNYGCRARADILRDRLWEDVAGASAVFCLGRTTGTLNEIHPSTIPLPAGFHGRGDRSAQRFLAVLENEVAEAAGIFTPYEGLPPPAI